MTTLGLPIPNGRTEDQPRSGSPAPRLRNAAFRSTIPWSGIKEGLWSPSEPQVIHCQSIEPAALGAPGPHALDAGARTA